MTNRSSEAPPPIGNGSVAVECNGYAAGRGSGWVSFQGVTRGVTKGSKEGHHQLEVTKSGVEVVHFAKNKVGIHVVELEAITKPKPKTAGAMEFKFVSSQTFNLYGNASGLTEKETGRWCKWVAKRPMGRIVAVCITDTAMAKTRPLKAEVYEALHDLGADKSLRLIGYREPFAFVGWKGLKQGKGVVGQDPKKQSKTLVRIETTVRKGTSNRDGTGLEFQEVKQDEVKLLGALSAAKKKQSQKKRAALPSPPLSPKKKKLG
uniref:ILEI/PANDER domain-containing protein n=1 Tax=Octactis speculum TaxID=3111310 RepID=A0A7S2AT11_9STRA|mmetsp:Transcript_14569/g.19433  ORF Transcript_14569/g.19433 Transcript_14569/m.19433 type:complete len:262 (+) Transcript_14569:88-873(+)